MLFDLRIFFKRLVKNHQLVTNLSLFGKTSYLNLQPRPPFTWTASDGKNRSLRCHVSWPIAARMTRAALAETLGLTGRKLVFVWGEEGWMEKEEVQVLKLFFLVEDEPPLLWPTVWCYRDSFQAADLFVSHASQVKVIRASKHPTKRFRFFKDDSEC